METKKDSFIRWQGRSTEELGKAINLLLSLCLATIGFAVSKLLDKEFQFQNCTIKSILIFGVSIILISTIILLRLIYNRLFAFRLTAQIARKRETNQSSDINSSRQEVQKKDKLTWTLFKLSIVSFVVGELFIIIGFIIEISFR